MTDRDDILANIRTWTAAGVTVNGPEDQALFQKFYDENPEFKQAILDGARERQAKEELERELEWRRRQDPGVLERMRLMKEVVDARLNRQPTTEAASVANPKRMSEAVEAFVRSKTSSAGNSERTLQDKKRLLLGLCDHLGKALPELTTDPWVHEVQPNHLASFMDAKPVRQHRRDSAPVDGVAPIAAATAEKKISYMRSFFSYAHKVLKASHEDASQAFADRVDDLKSNKSRQKSSYKLQQQAPRANLRAEDIFGIQPGSRLLLGTATGNPPWMSPRRNRHLGARFHQARRGERHLVTPGRG